LSPYKRAKLEAHRPKKPLSAYIYFSQEFRERLKTEHPDWTGQEIMKKVSHTWQHMSKEEKAPFDKAANDDKDRYEKELKHFNFGKSKKLSFVKLRDEKANQEIYKRTHPSDVHRESEHHDKKGQLPAVPHKESQTSTFENESSKDVGIMRQNTTLEFTKNFRNSVFYRKDTDLEHGLGKLDPQVASASDDFF